MLRLRSMRFGDSPYLQFLQPVSKLRVQVLKRLLLSGVTPTHLTMTGGLICIASALLSAANASLVVVGLVFAVGAIFDAVDGLMARLRTDMSSPVGGFIDTVTDKLGETALLLGLGMRFVDPYLIRLVAAAGFFGLLTSFVKAAAGEYGLSVNWPEVKLYGRAIRAAILSIGVFAAGVTDSDSRGIAVTLVILCTFNATTLLTRLFKIVMIYVARPKGQPNNDLHADADKAPRR